MKSKKLGVNENFLVTRKLKLAGPVVLNANSIVDDIEDLLGVQGAVISLMKYTLRISYDASKRSLDDVLDIAARYSCDPVDSRFQRMKIGWYRYFDSNIKENAEQPPWSCH